MKQLFCILFFMTLILTGYGQVGVGTNTPDASALLDVSGTTGGFLPPRVSYTQMNAIASPAEGLMVYCTDCFPKGMYYFDGTDFLSGITGNTSLVPASGRVALPKTRKVEVDRNSDFYNNKVTNGGNTVLYTNSFQMKKSDESHESKESDAITKLTD